MRCPSVIKKYIITSKILGIMSLFNGPWTPFIDSPMSRKYPIIWRPIYIDIYRREKDGARTLTSSVSYTYYIRLGNIWKI